MRVIVLIVCLILPTQLHAGAWPRDEGSVFVATSLNISHDSTGAADGYQSLYAEYGVTPKLTFGVRLWRRADGQHGDAVFFATYPISRADSAQHMTLGLGVGVRQFNDGRTRAILAPQFDWGTDFQSPIASGWMSISTSFGHVIGTDETFAKADLTLGLKPNKKTHLVLQLRGFHESSGSVVSLAPTYVREIRKGMRLEIGATYRMTGRNRLGLLLGSWTEF